MKKLIYALLLTLGLFLVSCSNKNNENSTDVQTDTDSEAIADSEESDIDMDDAPILVASAISSKEALKNTSHEVSGEVSIFSDNTLNIENFSYDGGAPDVYVYLGYYDGDDFVPVHRVSNLLDRSYENELFITTIPTDVDLDSNNVVSIWCDKFTEDMGSTELTFN